MARIELNTPADAKVNSDAEHDSQAVTAHPRMPRYRSVCKRDLCKGNKCGLVHPDQVEFYGHDLRNLPVFRANKHKRRTDKD
ncbi:hypothetical protein IAQ61_005237 [Plenodomus lingam]|uniref:uncharacterized protein n=1 Tax=Leptosphaeria maculans TaxID=5022 RepID=UPI00331FC2CB|nr:hypothetical protein IAQ61_005237 [Plenodomus lingam]